MKKLITCLLLLVTTTMVHAQFEQNKWYINTSITEMGMTYSDTEKFRMGIQGTIGAFLFDNVAFLINAEGRYHKKGERSTTLGVGGRYYLQNNGVYLGGGVKFRHYEYKTDGDKSKDKFNDGLLSLEAGYAFFLSRTVTLEPSVYYDLSFKNSDYSKFGLKVGFGFYF